MINLLQALPRRLTQHWNPYKTHHLLRRSSITNKQNGNWQMLLMSDGEKIPSAIAPVPWNPS